MSTSHREGMSGAASPFPMSICIWKLVMSYSPVKSHDTMRPLCVSTIAVPITSCVFFRFGVIVSKVFPFAD